MPFQTDRIGVAEAMLDGLKSACIAKLSDFTLTLAVSPVIALGTALSPSFFRIGDVAAMPDSIDFPFWVCIVGGGRQDGRDQHYEITASGPQFRVNVWHNIYFYLHPDTFPNTNGPVDASGNPTTDPLEQAETRERFRARFQDWLVNDVFNNPAGHEIILTSRQFAVAPNFDKLTRAYITDVTKGYVMKSFGDSDGVFMAHFVHEGLLLGGY